MFCPRLLILAAHVLLRATVTPVIGPPLHIEARFPDGRACQMAAAEIADAAPDDDVSFTCTKRWDL